MNKQLDEARKRLFGSVTRAPEPVKTDPVSIFGTKIDKQIEFARTAEKGGEVNTRSVWFKRSGEGYIVKIGRDALDFGEGKTLFAAKTLAEVVELLESAKTIIAETPALKQQIETRSKERSERLQKAKKN